MAGIRRNRLLAERPLPRDGQERNTAIQRKAPRTVTVNLGGIAARLAEGARAGDQAAV